MRVSPNELTFTAASAWREIYATRPELPKSEFGAVEVPNGVRAIATVPGAEEHKRVKKVVGHAFSEGAVRAQESIIQKYSDGLVTQLGRLLESKVGEVEGGKEGEGEGGWEGEVDLHQWFNFESFDMMGELSFGESFHCLENGENHPWVTAVFQGVKIAQCMTVLQYFWPALPIVKALLPPVIRRKMRASFEFTREVIDRRIAAKTERYVTFLLPIFSLCETPLYALQRSSISRPFPHSYAQKSTAIKLTISRPDFLHHIFKNNPPPPSPGNLTRPEIDATATFLVLAGSDTTAQTLSSVIYHTLLHPHVMARLRDEVDAAFPGDSWKEVTTAAAGRLEYMHAVVLEALRMHAPNAVSVPRVVDREGVVVGGWKIPVGVSLLSPNFLLPRLLFLLDHFNLAFSPFSRKAETRPLGRENR